MPAHLCFWFHEKEFCIPIYVDWDKWRRPDPGPLRIEDILTFPEIRQDRSAGGPYPIPWLTEIGLDARQQQTLGSMVRVWDAAQNLPAKARDQIGEILNAGAKDFGLSEGANLSFNTDIAR